MKECTSFVRRYLYYSIFIVHHSLFTEKDSISIKTHRCSRNLPPSAPDKKTLRRLPLPVYCKPKQKAAFISAAPIKLANSEDTVMDILFEIIISGFIEIFVELVGAAGSKKIPLPIRLLIATLLCGAVIAIVLLIGFSFRDSAGAAGLIGVAGSSVVGLGLTGLWLFWCMKIIRGKAGQ